MLEFYNRLKKEPLMPEEYDTWWKQSKELFESLNKQVTEDTFKALPRKSGPAVAKAYKEIARVYKASAPVRYRYLRPFDGMAEFLDSIKPSIDKYKKKAFRTSDILRQGEATVSDITSGKYMLTWALHAWGMLMEWNKCVTNAEFGHKEAKKWMDSMEVIVSLMQSRVVDDVFTYDTTIATESNLRTPAQVGRGFIGVLAGVQVGIGALMAINTASHAYGSIKTEYQQFSDAQEHQWKLVVADSRRKAENKPDDPRLKAELAKNERILKKIQMRIGREG